METQNLYAPLAIKEVEFKNRIVVSPMCQYSVEKHDGFPTDWHRLHYAERAKGGAGLVILEATAVTAQGRISPADLGIWSDAHIKPLAELVRLIHANGAKAGVQIAHAGRKASNCVPWLGTKPLTKENGGWDVVSASAIAFDAQSPVPKEADLADIASLIESFAQAARRADEAGFDVIEIHAAHGYLVHQFYSPLSNKRADSYGGDLAGRLRFAREVTGAMRKNWPRNKPLFLRVSATDWTEGGWDLGQTLELVRAVKEEGVDLVDVSSGGLIPGAKIPDTPDYQLGFATEIREKTGILTGTVGRITEFEQAKDIVEKGKADMVFLARLLLRDPYWPLRHAPGEVKKAQVPPQYVRGFPDGAY